MMKMEPKIKKSGFRESGFSTSSHKTARNISALLLIIAATAILSSAAFADLYLSSQTGNIYLNTTNIARMQIAPGGNIVLLGQANVTLPANLTVDAGTLFVDSANNMVGIGTTAPAATLDVKGKANFTGNFSVGQTSNIFFVDNTSGYVGIGTTGPAQKVQITAPAGFPATSGTSQNGMFRLTRNDAGTNIMDMGVMSTSPSGAWIQVTDSGNLATIYPLALNPNGGNVGIGTTAPLSLLHLNKSDTENTSVTNVLTLDHTLSNPVNSTGRIGVSILFRATDNASQIYNIGNISAVLYNATNGSQLGALTFSTSGSDTGDESFGHLTERLRIDGYGRVGIGTASPNAKLTVIGGANISGGLNVTNGDVLLAVTGGNVGIGTSTPNPNAKLEVNGTANFGGNVNVGGGYSGGGVSLMGTGADKGSGQFAKDIMIDGAIVAIYDVEINKSFIPVKDLYSLMGNVTNRFLDLFAVNIKAGNVTLNITGNVSIGQDTLFVDNASRRVGIGTASPASKLTIIGDVNITGSINASGNATFPQLKNCDTINTDANGLLTCGTDAGGSSDIRNSTSWNRTGTNVVLAEQDDKVGIGTKSPATTLDVKGKANFTGNFSVGQTSNIFFVDNTSGYVGIGTASPTTLLSLGNSYGDNTVKLALYDNGGSDIYGFGVSADASLDIYPGGAPSGGPKMVIKKTTGNVGIGTTAPTEKLVVAGNANVSGTLYANNVTIQGQNGSLYQPVYGTDDDLVLYLPFSENAVNVSNKTYDRSPYGNDGTLNNMNAGGIDANNNGSAWANAKYGYGMEFDGREDYINTPRSASLEPTAFTLSAWVKISGGAGSDRGILNKLSGATQSGYRLNLRTTDKFSMSVGTGAGETFINSNSAYTDTGWHYIAGTYDGTMRLYVDGVKQNEESTTAMSHDTTNGVSIGTMYSNSPNYYWNGTIDEVMIYKRALAPEEIRTHYLRGKGFGASGAITADKFRIVNTSGSVVLATNGSKVGIGTTNPKTQLAVGQNTFPLHATGATANYIGFNWYYDAGTWRRTIADTAVVVETTNAQTFAVYTAATGAADSAITWTQFLSIDGVNSRFNIPNGNVGINTTGPGHLLNIHSAGNSYPLSLTSSSIGTAGNWLGILFGFTDSTYQKGAIIYEGQDGDGRGKMYFALDPDTGGGNVVVADAKMTITYGGKVGIGTTSPGAKLEVVGNLSVNGSIDIIDTNGSLYQPVYGTDDDLVLYLPFSENAVNVSNRTYDRSPYGNDGTLNNMNYGNNTGEGSENRTGWASGKYGYGIEFDGSNDYVNVVDSNSLDITDAITITAWINTRNAADADTQRIVQKGGGTSIYDLFIQDTGALRGLFTLDTGQMNIYGNTVIPNNQWTFIGVTIESATGVARLYYNGQVDVATSFTGKITTDNNNLVIGAFRGLAGDAQRFNGTIDEVMIYKRALLPEEIRTHYLRGKGFGASGAITADKFRIVNTSGSKLLEVNQTAFSVKNASGGDNLFYVDKVNNRVGIGTTGPTQRLYVAGGQAHFERGGKLIQLNPNYGETNQWSALESASDMELRLTSGGSNVANGIVIKTTGRVGIGTTSPGAKLEIVGNLSVNGSIDIIDTNGSLYQPVYGTDDGLVLYLPFSENAVNVSNKTYDRSPYGNDGTLNNMNYGNNTGEGSENRTGWASGKYGYGIEFDGSNDYVSLGQDTFTTAQTTKGTIEMWFKPNTLVPAEQYLIDFEGAIIIRLGQTTLKVYNDGSGTGVTYTLPQTDKWYHVAMAWDNVIIKLYLDGREVNSTSATTFSLDTLNRAQTIGSNWIYASNFNGSIDEVMIYKRALAAEEIRTHYLRGKGFGASGAITADKFRIVNTSGSKLLEVNQTAFSVKNASGGDNLFYVDKVNNRVGIGTTGPGVKFEVKGADNNVRFTSDTSGNAARTWMEFKQADGTRIGYFGDVSTTTSDIELGVDSGNLILSPSGKVGIGTTSPGAKLEVVGNLSVNGSIDIIDTNGSLYQPVYGTDDGLVLYLPFSENAVNVSNKTYDRSPYGNDGTLNNMNYGNNTGEGSENRTGWASGKYGYGIEFDGVNDFVSYTDPGTSSLDLGGSMTLSGWFKFNSVGSSSFISKRNSAGTAVNYLLRYSNGFDFNIRNTAGTNQEWTFSWTPVVGRWYFVAATYDDSSKAVKGYVDGSNIGSATAVGSPATDDQPVRIGNDDGTSGFLNGTADEIMIYKRALSPEEIRTHYLRGKGFGASGAITADKFRIVNTSASKIFEINQTGATIAPGGVQRLTIDSSGNVGIGDTGPDSKLDVEAAQAQVRVESTTGTNIVYQTFVNTAGNFHIGTESSAGGNLVTGGLSYAGIVNMQGNYPLQFGTNNNARMTISSGGKVGIGTTSPGQKLHVIGSINATNIYGDGTETFDIAQSGSGGIRSSTGNAADSSTERMLIPGGADIVNVSISNSNVGIGTATPTAGIELDVEGQAECDGAGCWTVESDIAYKENIRDLDYGLNTILQLSPKRYNLKENGENSFGLIAQDVEKIIPEIVRGEEGTKNVGYDGLAPVLVKAVQEQQQQIEELKQEIQELKNK